MASQRMQKNDMKFSHIKRPSEGALNFNGIFQKKRKRERARASECVVRPKKLCMPKWVMAFVCTHDSMFSFFLSAVVFLFCRVCYLCRLFWVKCFTFCWIPTMNYTCQIINSSNSVCIHPVWWNHFNATSLSIVPNERAHVHPIADECIAIYSQTHACTHTDHFFSFTSAKYRAKKGRIKSDRDSKTNGKWCRL